MNTDFARQQMIEQQVRAWEVLDSNVLDGLREVPRELFVPGGYEALAFADTEIPVGHGQRMMTPTIEGRVLQALEAAGHLRFHGHRLNGANAAQNFDDEVLPPVVVRRPIEKNLAQLAAQPGCGNGEQDKNTCRHQGQPAAKIGDRGDENKRERQVDQRPHRLTGIKVFQPRQGVEVFQMFADALLFEGRETGG